MASLVFATHLTRASCVWRPQVKAPAFAPITLGAPTGGGGRITPLDLSLSLHRMTRCTANAKLCGDKKNPGGLGFRQDNKALGDVVLAVVGSTIQLPLRQNTLPAGLWGTEPRVGSLSYDPSEAPTTRTRISARATEETTYSHARAPLALPEFPAGVVSMSDSVFHTAYALEGRDTIWGSTRRALLEKAEGIGAASLVSTHRRETRSRPGA